MGWMLTGGLPLEEFAANETDSSEFLLPPALLPPREEPPPAFPRPRRACRISMLKQLTHSLTCLMTAAQVTLQKLSFVGQCRVVPFCTCSTFAYTRRDKSLIFVVRK